MYTSTNNTSSVQSGFDYTSLNVKTETKQTDMEVQQDRFMKLLVKQLQSQDPLNPVDSAQTTSQMAQISTVTGIEKLNQSMTQLMSTFSAMQGMQAASLIGRSVLATGDAAAFDGTNAMQFKVAMPDGADSLSVAIYDESGQLVDKFELPTQTAGTKGFKWDGVLADGTTAKAGTYYIAAQGSVSGKEVAMDTQTWQKALSIELGSDGTKVVLADGSKVDFSKVTQIQ